MSDFNKILKSSLIHNLVAVDATPEQLKETIRLLSQELDEERQENKRLQVRCAEAVEFRQAMEEKFKAEQEEVSLRPLPRIWSWDELANADWKQFRGKHFIQRNHYQDLLNEVEKFLKQTNRYIQRSVRQEKKIRELQEQLEFVRESAQIWQVMFEQLEAVVYEQVHPRQ